MMKQACTAWGFIWAAVWVTGALGYDIPTSNLDRPTSIAMAFIILCAVVNFMLNYEVKERK